MNNKIKILFFNIIWYIFSYKHSLYADEAWVLWDFHDSAINQKSNWSIDAIRKWDIHLDNIPDMIKNAIDFFINIAWTVAIIFIIIWGYKILLGSLESDKSKWKETIIMALTWFILASLAWFIVKIIIDNLSN